jgi:hypothetical protein
MESPRDPLPAYLSAEPDPADPPPAEAMGPQTPQPAAGSAAQPAVGSAAQAAAQSTAGPEPPPAVPRPRDPGESTEPLRLDESAEPLRLGESAEPLPSSDADLIAASRAGDAAAYDTLYRRHVTAAHGVITAATPLAPPSSPSTRDPLCTRAPAPRPGSWALVGLPRGTCGAGDAQAPLTMRVLRSPPAA